jgi:hypothetical protein
MILAVGSPTLGRRIDHPHAKERRGVGKSIRAIAFTNSPRVTGQPPPPPPEPRAINVLQDETTFKSIHLCILSRFVAVPPSTQQPFDMGTPHDDSLSHSSFCPQASLRLFQTFDMILPID